MKKTLVALAVLAASGASFAQVTMTGEFTWGYKAISNKYTAPRAGVAAVPPSLASYSDSSGFGVNYSNINFMATEDLGGGTKVAVKMGLDGADRSNDGGSSMQGQDASITLTGSFGRLMLGTLENKDYLSQGIAGVGNPAWINQDGHVFSANKNADRIEYSYALGAVTLGYQFLEAASGINEGAGISGDAAVVGQPRNLLQATYAAGPLTANAGFGVYSNQTDGKYSSSKSVARISGAYDLGVAKIGAGYVNLQKNTGSQIDTFLAAAIPFGALTLGMDWAQRKTDFGGDMTARTDRDGNMLMDGTISGYGIGAAYALSKRTQLVANYRTWDAAVGSTNKSTDTRFYIDHSF